MPVQIDIDDTTLSGFNSQAKEELKKATLKFSDDLLKESFRIEAAHNTASGNPQVTSSMVTDATTLMRRGFAQPKKKIWNKILRIVAAILSMAVGFTYDATKLQDKTYMLTFVVVVAFAILAVIVSIIWE